MIRIALAFLLALFLSAPGSASAQSAVDLSEGKEEVLSRIPRSLKNASDFTCLAVTLYHEARGEGVEGMRAVATVVINRVRTPGRWGDHICEVVDPTQFTYFLDEENLIHPPITEYDAWVEALEVATVIMVEGPDPWLQDADHYHKTDTNPTWNRNMVHIETLQNHIFWADPEAAKRRG